MKKFIRKITKASSHSYTINIPKTLMKLWGWKERQKLVLTPRSRKQEFTVKDWKKKQK